MKLLISCSILCGGFGGISKDEQSLGTALIDIGGGSTTLAVFDQGHLKETCVIPIGGEHITKDLSIGLRTATEDAEKIKIKYGHAFYDYASEDEVFSVPIIGSDQHQQFNQLELSDIIEARMEEIFELVQQELKKMGSVDLPGGFVLTGGGANMPGVLELGQEIFQNRVRVAIPDYIGVREPQYTTAIGLIRYAYKNARLQGRSISTAPVQYSYDTGDKRTENDHSAKQNYEKNSDEKFSSKIKKFFGLLFE